MSWEADCVDRRLQTTDVSRALSGTIQCGHAEEGGLRNSELGRGKSGTAVAPSGNPGRLTELGMVLWNQEEMGLL